MRARLVAARHEHAAAGAEAPDRRERVIQPAQPGWVERRTDEQEIVMHHQAAVQQITRIGEHAFRVRRVGEHHVRIAAAAQLERLAAADGDHLDPVSAAALELRQNRVEQPRISSAGGGGKEDLARLDGRRPLASGDGQ
jgi:hypothetical protein